MAINLTATYLAARQNPILLMFSGWVFTTSVAIPGPGGADVDGYPVPISSHALKLAVYDGSTVRTGTMSIPLNEGDRISLYATYVNPTFTVNLVLNGAATQLQVSGCAANSLLQATLLLQLEEG